MGFFSGIGGILNDVMGVTSAGKQNQAYALQSAQVNNQYQKEFAQNQLQWTVQDAQKAGINPIYAIGGGGSGAGGSGGVSSGSSQPTGNPFAAIAEIGNLYNQSRATSAGVQQTEAQTTLTNLQVWRTAFENGLLDKYGEKEKIIALNIAEKTGHLIDAQTAQAVASGKLSIEQAIKTAEETKRIKGGKLSEWGGTDTGSFFEEMENSITKRLRRK